MKHLELFENFKSRILYFDNFNDPRSIVEGANFEELREESDKQSGILQLNLKDLENLEKLLTKSGYEKQMGSPGILALKEGKYIWVRSLSGIRGASATQDQQNMRSLKEDGENVGQNVRYDKKEGSSFKNITFYKIIKK